jgi:acetyl esterase/lipase
MKHLIAFISLSLFVQLGLLQAAPEEGSTVEKARLNWAFTPDPDLPNVLILGDSISIGYTLEVRELLKGVANVYRPASADGRKPINCSDTITGLKRLDGQLEGHDWSVIHFNWGLHDLKHVKEAGKQINSSDPNDPQLTTARQYARNMSRIVSKLEGTGARLVFATTTPVVPGTTNPLREPDAPKEYNAAAIKLIKANNIRVNDLYAFCEPHLDEWQLPKNVHFKPEGSSALAKQVASVIREELAAVKADSAEDVKPAAKAPTKKVKSTASYLETGGERKLDLVYKKVGKRELQMDLYYPTANQSDSPPVIIYTHGGGWAAGSRAGASKALFAGLFKELLSKGFCVASVDYRLARNGVSMRDCVIDSKDAVRYLAKHSEALKVDADRFLVFGDSAGGQIAQMLLLSPHDSLTGDPELADVSYQILGGVSWYGPCDFEDQNLFNYDDRPDFKDRFGARIVLSDVSPDEKLRLYREMSPITYLKKDSPPLLMIQGDKDTTIPVKHAHYMKKRANELEAPVEIMIIKNSGHNWRQAGGEIEPPKADIDERTVSFFTEFIE